MLAKRCLFCRNKKTRKGELQKESDHKSFRNLSPRDRLRIQKQLQADEEAKRIVWVSNLRIGIAQVDVLSFSRHFVICHMDSVAMPH